MHQQEEHQKQPTQRGARSDRDWHPVLHDTFMRLMARSYRLGIARSVRLSPSTARLCSAEMVDRLLGLMLTIFSDADPWGLPERVALPLPMVLVRAKWSG
ncbi:hypothetical protein [Synechococcus sp. MIT S1220]|uniref:hypothetical protein n=1 Tax=Synechococcus sp. MIT S1220 TaxID=3082549 RepID=UPI0039AF40C7